MHYSWRMAGAGLFAALVWTGLSLAAQARDAVVVGSPDGSPDGASGGALGGARAPLTLVVHGGAGALEKGRYTAEEEAAFHADLRAALDAGYGVLNNGGEALAAVAAAIVVLEDSPHFNAGRGAVFTRDGRNELDASIMDGRDANAGAVAGVTRVKNPILLAKAVMEKSEHVMFAREGAENFAREQGLETAPKRYFRTDRRWRAYREALEREKANTAADKDARIDDAVSTAFKYGTVGAVALDAAGNLAAGTSTGGMTLKRFGRVGDSPIIGAGTYADNRSCAVSSTGHGEYFIRLTVARDICAQVEYGGASLTTAAENVIHDRLGALGGDGGIIAVAPDGAVAMVFNSAGMFRGVKQAGGAAETAIYGAGAEVAE